MFDPRYSHSVRSSPFDIKRSNWECDICDVLVERCNISEDPSGFSVTYYKNYFNDDHSFQIGASYLKDRLKKLSRAGFDAPMTKKALNIIDQKRIKAFRKAV